MSAGFLMKLSLSWLMCTNPSWCTPISMNAPKAVTLVTIPGQPESRLEVLEFADAFRILANFKLLSRITARLSELIHDVGQGRKPDRISDVLIESDAFT